MAGHHVLPVSPPPSTLRRLSAGSLTGQIQTQAMSHAKFIFLIALVIFFIVLFMAAYVWMRRPDFGQKGGHATPAASGGTIGRADHGVPSDPTPAAEVGVEVEVETEVGIGVGAEAAKIRP
jgi:hypothetical protein